MPDSLDPSSPLSMIDSAAGRRLVRYLAGECSPGEADEVRAWIVADPSRTAIIDDLTRVWQATASAPSHDDTEAIWREFVAAREARRVRPLHGRGSELSQTTSPERRSGRGRPSPWWLRVAAVAAIIMVTMVGALWRAVSRGAVSTVEHADAAAADSARVYVTRRGERAEFRLADGSRVLLGVDSRLWVPADFGARARTVHLVGEAYFEVVHDTTRPFLVRAGGTVTEDLGTRFGVRAYAGGRIRVVVADGAVAVRDTMTRTAAVLRQRDLALVSDEGRVVVERDVDPDAYLAWTTGRLVFQDNMLTDVVQELERRFDVRVTVKDSTLLAARVSASFDDSGLDDILSVLARTLDADVERRGSSILVRRRD